MKGESKKAKKIRAEIEGLKRGRRRVILLFVGAIVAVVAMTVVRHILVAQGVVASDDATSNMIVFIVSLGLCFLLAPHINAFFAAGHKIKELEKELD